MEAPNALFLFRRAQSENFPFVYKTVVSDLDSKVLPLIAAEFPWVTKEHCRNHLSKSMRKHMSAGFFATHSYKLKPVFQKQLDKGI